MHYDLLRLSLRSKDLSFGLSFKTFSYGVFTSPRIYNVDTCLCHKSKTSGAPLNSSSRQQFVVSTWRTWRLGELGDFGPAHSRGCPSVGTTTLLLNRLFVQRLCHVPALGRCSCKILLLHHGFIAPAASPSRHHTTTPCCRPHRPCLRPVARSLGMHHVCA